MGLVQVSALMSLKKGKRKHRELPKIHYVANVTHVQGMSVYFQVNKVESLCQEDRAKFITMREEIITCRRCKHLFNTFPHLTLVPAVVKR